MKISFIGFGKLAKLIAAGLKTEQAYQLYASAPSLPEEGQVDGVKTAQCNVKIVEGADCVILAVKPAQIRTVLAEIGPHLPSDSLLISVAAGVELATLAASCCHEQAIVRAMPNVASAVQHGASALFKNQWVHTQHAKMTESIFERLGFWAWVEHEVDLDRLTALSGSGPGYVFLFLEALIEGGIELGLTAEIARKFAIEMVLGSVILAKESSLDLKQLRFSVISPGGTTQAALNVLEADHWDVLVKKAMHQAFLKAQALSKL